MQPKDEDELQDMICTGVNHQGPTFIRYPRGSGEGVRLKEKPENLLIGKAEILREGTDVVLWALGPFVRTAMEIAERMSIEEGIQVGVVNARFAKPLDKDLLTIHAKSYPSIVTLEDHVLSGGFGSAVLEFLEEQNIIIPVTRIGWPDQFLEHASSNKDLREKNGLCDEEIYRRVLSTLTSSGHSPEHSMVFAD